MNTISVIILTYNKLELLYEALDSVLMQNYPSIELIISDDGTKDLDQDGIKSYIQKNTNGNICSVIIRQNKDNIGTVRNLNKALQCATGAYIVPIAGDDAFYNSDVLTSFVNSFDKLSSDAMLITTQVKKYDELMQNCLGDLMSREKIELLSAEFDALYAHLALDCFMPSGGTAYRKSMFDRYGLFDERFKLVEDWPFYLKMTRMGVRIYYHDFISVKHRDGGTSHGKLKTPTFKQYQTDLIQIMAHEILPNISFAKKDLQEKIRIQCNDKIIIYKLRFEFPAKKLPEKILWMFKTRDIVPAIYRRLRRRY